ncbi:hypothetical protein HMPREF1554_01217 [Porphyromonas gingivalis F0569]|nr:hypothetical protein HMPREF1554_01217 [Porphyromonas gingivalis F0569]
MIVNCKFSDKRAKRGCVKIRFWCSLLFYSSSNSKATTFTS